MTAVSVVAAHIGSERGGPARHTTNRADYFEATDGDAPHCGDDPDDDECTTQIVTIGPNQARDWEPNPHAESRSPQPDAEILIEGVFSELDRMIESAPARSSDWTSEQWSIWRARLEPARQACGT